MADAAAPVGFIGLGAMGEPMALNLARAGVPLVVWNRTPAKAAALQAAGAELAPSADAVLARTDTILLMLADGAAVDAVLRRDAADLAERLGGRTVVCLGTTAPDYSEALAADLARAGAAYLECPVSGSRVPAEAGQLVALLAGEAAVAERVRPLLAPMCRAVIHCGAVPSGLRMKLAVNLVLLPLITALAESMHFAARNGLDLGQLAAIIDAGPLASVVTRTKAAKLAAGDFAVQATVANALENCRLTAEAARRSGAAAPLIDACHALYRETLALGHGEVDMVAVLRAFERRSALGTG